MPTAEEVEEHNATHLPHRSWCPVCVKARGDAHRRVKQKGEKPTVNMDCKTFGEEANKEDKITMIVAKGESTRCAAANRCQQKGARDAWVITRICDDIDTLALRRSSSSATGSQPSCRRRTP